MYRVNVNESELKKLYLKEGMSIENIAKKMHIGKNTVRDRIKKYGIAKTESQIKFNKEELFDLYITKNLTQEEIADIKNVSKKRIARELKNNGITKSKELFYSQVKSTVKRKYGVDNISQINDVKKKKEKKSVAKYGVKNISQAVEIKEKKSKKALEKYGVKDVLSAPEVRNKIIDTNMRKYGVKNPLQNDKIHKKAKETCKAKYGKEYPGQVDGVKEKIRKTCIDRYGVPSVFLYEPMKEKIKKSYKNKSNNEKRNIQKKIRATCMKKYGVPYPCMTKKCKNSSGNVISKINKTMSKLLLENGIKNKLEYNLGNYSYDIIILNSNILLEINPTYTHNSTLGTEFRGFKKTPLLKEYHFNKTINAKNNGYRCIHIWDWDDTNKIISLLKPKEKVYARKCKIKIISREERNNFLGEYHLQGTHRAKSIDIGLVYNGELVELISFGKPRYNKRYEYELLRLCSNARFEVVGGASKIFNYFIKEYNPKSIISYCDNSKFDGTIYNKLGFKLKDYGKPTRHWYNMKTKRHITDNLLRQRGFDQLFNENYGKGTSNEELMRKNGFVEVYDCGQSVYEYVKIEL